MLCKRYFQTYSVSSNNHYIFPEILTFFTLTEMSWSTLFYPGNPGRRDDVVRLSQKFYDLMTSNFWATNELIDCLHEYVPPPGGRKFRKVYIDGSKTIKENCQKIIDRMEEIQDYVDDMNEKLREVLEPKLFEKLTDVDTSFIAKFKLMNSLTKMSLGVIGKAMGAVLVGAIKSGRILTNMVTKLGLIQTCACAVLVLGILVMGVDMIFSAIYGSIERDKLIEAVDDLTANIEQFEAPTIEYTKSIYKLVAYIEFTNDPF